MCIWGKHRYFNSMRLNLKYLNLKALLCCLSPQFWLPLNSSVWTKTVMLIWNDMRVSKWWQNLSFSVELTGRLSLYDILMSDMTIYEISICLLYLCVNRHPPSIACRWVQAIYPTTRWSWAELPTCTWENRAGGQKRLKSENFATSKALQKCKISYEVPSTPLSTVALFLCQLLLS